jgi:hypothetical protein
MAGGQQVVLYERRCHARDCGALFYICRSCYRGQRYCSEPCRQTTRREQQRAANGRHQQSPEGRLDHRDRQRAYRQLRLAGRVTDQGSAPESASGSMPQRDPIELKPGRRELKRVRCLVCGRRGEFIEMFKRRE